MRTTIILLLLIATAPFQKTKAQEVSADKEVESAITRLFDGMRSSDSSVVASVFTRDAIMQTVLLNEEGVAYLHSGSLNSFLEAISTEKSEIWDEKILSYDIKIDGNLASVWTPYMFYRGEEFSHCGVNSFQLMNVSGGWKIFHIVDTRRTENCDFTP